MREPRMSVVMGGVLLISLSALSYELILTRIASVVMLYHFAFLAVSLALLGMSVAGICVYVLKRRFTSDRVNQHASLFCLCFSLSLPLALLAALHVPPGLDLSLQSLATQEGMLFVVITLAMALPFFFSGLTISLILTHFGQEAGRVYFADLVGASLGCLLIIPVMNLLGGIQGLFFIAILGSCAALLFAWVGAAKTPAWVAVAFCVVLTLFAAFNSSLGLIRIRQIKGVTEEEPVYERWNSFSRVAVYPSNALSSEIDTMSILIDGYAFTAMARFDGDLSKLEPLKLELASLPYHLPNKRNVLIIGSGGGLDVLIALHFGSESVTAVEINPFMMDIVDNEFPEFSGRLYSRPDVTAVVDEGRAFIRNSDRTYDIIQATLVDTWAASQAGAYALSENYLYTREAFVDYLRHLSDDGILAMTRWYVDNPEEMLKLTSLALDAMKELDVERPEDHIVVARREFLGTVLVKRTPFTDKELSILEEASETFWFPIVYTPSTHPERIFVELIESPERESFHRTHGLQCSVSSSTDDRPFFFFCEQNDTLVFLLIVVLSLTAVTIAVPLAFAGGTSFRETLAEYSGALLYFACLGVGFMLVEIVLIQRFILILGHPAYAISVILFSLLLFGGLGSLLSSRFPDQQRGLYLKGVLVGLVLLLAVYNVGYAGLVHGLTHLGVAHRIGLTVLLMGPLGLLMGMPFPLALKSVHSREPRVVPWVWAVNGTLSILGSVLAAMLSISVGFTVALVFGQLAYLVALLIVLTRRMASRTGVGSTRVEP